MENTAQTYLNQQKEEKKKNTVIIIIVIIVALIGGIFILRQTKKNTQDKVAVVKETEPTPTEKPKIGKSSVKIQVLNGTGTPGQAAAVVDALKKADYNQDNIKTGNAPDFNHTITTISAKTGFEEIADDVKQTLADMFDNIEIESSPLDEDSEFDIVVITGGKKFEENETTPTPTPSPSEATATPTISPTPSPTSTPTPTP